MANTPSRIDLYLQDFKASEYTNTEYENNLVGKFVTLYTEAKSAQNNQEECSPQNLAKWRKAYLGTLNALTSEGKESTRKSRSLRKMVFELIESKIDNTIPMPKMKPRYKSDIPLVNITEEYLKFEVDRIFAKYNNDAGERATYVDGTTWYKVVWDSLNNTHERSGDVRIELRRVDEIVPQPGVSDYKQLEYIFERSKVSSSKIYDLYGRCISATDNNLVDVISCYYLNNNHIVGLFAWAEHSLQVICNEEDWQIRKLRKCNQCKTIVPSGDTCPLCGGTTFHFANAEEEILSETLYEVYNPYDEGLTDDETMKDQYEQRVFLEKGSTIPFYHIDQLPFVPRPAISSMNSIYGISEAMIILDSQDAINKLLTKSVDKTLKSGTVVTKPEKMKISDKDDTFKVFGVRSAEEAAMVQAKQIIADTSQDIAVASLLYDSGKASSGVTNSFQGQRDTTAVSGKAKEYSALQAAGRMESLRVMKNAAFAGIYELVLKYLLAFSDEKRAFVKVLPDGNEKEEVWSKYMFLAKDNQGNVYYRDDFEFSCDPAATLSQNRVQMWQETTEKFVQGAFGVPNDPRTLKLYWNTMDQLQYPLAKIALAGIKDNEQHLPPEVEQAIMANPQLMQTIADSMTSGQGGARANSGPEGNGATHAANVKRTNERNRAANKDIAFSAQSASAFTRGGT